MDIKFYTLPQRALVGSFDGSLFGERFQFLMSHLDKLPCIYFIIAAVIIINSAL